MAKDKETKRFKRAMTKEDNRKINYMNDAARLRKKLQQRTGHVRSQVIVNIIKN